MHVPESLVPASRAASTAEVRRLAEWLAQRSRVTAITGAGVSTASGIPDYRDGDGHWKRSPPVQYRDFVHVESVRKRYWARSLVGWPMFKSALPSAAHVALARLEADRRIAQLVTQNVDRLHERAGSREVIDLHGRLDVVRCLGCNRTLDRDEFQRQLLALNPVWASASAGIAPDGDADVTGVDFDRFRVPSCEVCGGILKPDVVFYGEAVPRARADAALDAAVQVDGVLVAGSSLMVWSSFRLVRAAVQRGISVVAVNRGHTRGDELLEFKLDAECGAVLAATAAVLGVGPDVARRRGQ